MLDALKAKFGHSAPDNRDYRENDFDQYDDYDQGDYAEDDYGYDEHSGSYDSNAAGPRYDPYATVSTRPARGAHASSSPRLVSIEDVRASTPVPESLMRDPLPPRRATYSSERVSVDASTTKPDYSVGKRIGALSGSDASSQKGSVRSPGLNSLFTPTDHVDEEPAADRRGAVSAIDTADQPTQAFDPHEALAGVGTSTYSTSRACVVIKPVSYSEVERVAKIVKAGDAVILGLLNTPDALSKRILDFSFGVASALDANVECVSDKVFAISRGNALSEVEKMKLRNQGVI